MRFSFITDEILITLTLNIFVSPSPRSKENYYCFKKKIYVFYKLIKYKIFKRLSSLKLINSQHGIDNVCQQIKLNFE